MGPALVFSVNDPAGKGIANYISEVSSADEVVVPRATTAYYLRDLRALLVGFEEEVINFSFLDEVLEGVSYYVVLSRHSATSGIKSLTTHHPGNPWWRADAGGRPYELSVANPVVAGTFIVKMREKVSEYGLSGFEVTYEVTHHGPTNLRRPITFIEIGSTPEEWRLGKAHALIGDTVIETLRDGVIKCIPSAGFGGPHYATRFSDLVSEGGPCFGHIIPRYALKELKGRLDMLKEVAIRAILNSVPKTSRVYLMKKVGGAVRNLLSELCVELGVECEIL